MKKMLLLGLLAAGFMGCTTPGYKAESKNPNAAMNDVTSFPAPNYEGAYWTEVEDREPANAAGLKCGNRVKQAGCYMSNNDMDRIDKGVRDCKQFRSQDGRTMEVFLMNKSGTVTTVQTSPVFAGGQCSRMKYDFGTNLVEIKALAGRVISRSTSGQVYFLGKNGAFYELLNSKSKSYSNVSNIEGKDAQGNSSNQHLTLTFQGNQKATFSSSDLDSKINSSGQARAIYFFNFSTAKSLFRDEDLY